MVSAIGLRCTKMATSGLENNNLVKVVQSVCFFLWIDCEQLMLPEHLNTGVSRLDISKLEVSETQIAIWL